ncbi:MAG: hypothetical protein FRX49_08794 [Trebouxia sp. A1-2]|nr:MAG: hypothetical protein FRX49_08794 [Trebouxia sp. A1-2]
MAERFSDEESEAFDKKKSKSSDLSGGMHDGFKAFVEGIESSFLAAFSDHFGRDARNTEHENLLKRQKRRLTDDFSRQKCKGFPAGEVLKAASKYLAETLLYSHGLGSQGESARLTVQNTAKAIIKAAYKQSGEDDAQLDDLIEQLNSKRPTVMAEAAKQMASIKEDKCQEEAQQRQTELLQSFSRQQTGTTTRQGNFLGLIVDACTFDFVVPQHKAEYISQNIAAALETNATTSRQLASIAGMLLSIATDVQMAPLYIRTLYEAMSTSHSWDGRVSHLELAVEDLQYWQQALALRSSKSWLKRDKVIYVCGDALSVGHEASTADRTVTMMQSSTSEEMEQANRLSSVFHELSRMEDTSELFITRRTFTSIICRQVGGSVWGKPPLDCFAGGAVGQHKADKYYMPFHTIHSTGVDATVQVLGEALPEGTAGHACVLESALVALQGSDQEVGDGLPFCSIVFIGWLGELG